MPCHNLATSGRPETRPLACAATPRPGGRLSISRSVLALLPRLSPERRRDCSHLLLRLSEWRRGRHAENEI